MQLVLDTSKRTDVMSKIDTSEKEAIMAVIGPFEYTVKYLCSSTDTKPSVSVPKGSCLYETDTGEIYLFDGTTWHQSEEMKNV